MGRSPVRPIMLRQPPKFVAAFCSAVLLVAVYCIIYGDFYTSLRKQGARWTTPRQRVLSTSRSSTVGNGTLGFGKIFVLSVPTRMDKRDQLVLAAALTGLKIDFRDGPDGAKISPKATPRLHFNKEGIFTKDGELGCWRGHMNILSEIVKENLETALILEDDADWDVNIVDQAEGLAAASRELSARLPYSEGHPPTPKWKSEYGTGWDLLHIGHCTGVAPADEWAKYHVLIKNDDTVPPPSSMNDMSIGAGDRVHCIGHEGRIPRGGNCTNPLASDTRVLQYRAGPQCTLGYAVSQQGARKMLARMGGMSVDDLSTAIDLQMREMCLHGTIRGRGRDPFQCLTLSPPIFLKHHPKGDASLDSDIRTGEEMGGLRRDIGETTGAVWSTRLNIEPLLAGKEPQTQFVWDDKTASYRLRKIDEYDVL